MHDFISKDNDKLIRDSLTNGVKMMREARAAAKPDERVTVVDLWVNACDPAFTGSTARRIQRRP